jgi:syntenin-1
MSALYPSLEDMKVDQMAQAQSAHVAQVQAVAHAIANPQATSLPPPAYSPGAVAVVGNSLYPSLSDYMGLQITQEMINQQMALMPAAPSQVAVHGSGGSQVVAPITGNSVGLRRAEIRSGVREVVLCKDQDGKLGLRVQSINKGVFVSFVHDNSPSSLVGLRFGDQILQINGENVAGWDTDKTMKVLKKAAPQRITMAIRDRPFERTITLQKDSAGTVGFVFKENKITAIVKDSSAARNGVLIDHHMVEVNGQNVIGLKEKQIKELFDKSERTVTITIVPSFVYDHIMKSIGSGLIKKHMDHSIPDV